MQSPSRILVFQTAFTGDVILTLPMIQRLQAHHPNVPVDVVATPSGASVLANHPAIHRVVVYDKKGTQRGLAAAYRLIRTLRSEEYDTALIPHRSIRSASICFGAGIRRRVGFSTSAGRFFMTHVVPYRKNNHEIARNLSLLQPLGIAASSIELPALYPSEEDKLVVDKLLDGHRIGSNTPLIAIAPGSVWATKRWLPERYHGLAQCLTNEGITVALIGGSNDVLLGEQIAFGLPEGRVIHAMGKLTVLQSAELIRRCKVFVGNDSSPMHLAVAMRTPVVAIFGATVPEFGFAPVGPRDQIVQMLGLPCRPCAIHGGKRCPIVTFDCMNTISVQHVLERIHHVLSEEPTTVA